MKLKPGDKLYRGDTGAQIEVTRVGRKYFYYKCAWWEKDGEISDIGTDWFLSLADRDAAKERAKAWDRLRVMCRFEFPHKRPDWMTTERIQQAIDLLTPPKDKP